MGCSIETKQERRQQKQHSKSIRQLTIKLSKLKVTLNHSIKDYKSAAINNLALNITKYYKDQLPPKNPKKMFIDPMFPPSDSSIFGETLSNSYFSDSTSNESTKHFKIERDSYVWLRPKDIFEGPYSIFEGKIEVGDTIQGAVGDCYFLSAISAMAQYPQMICQLYKNLTVTENGCYEIALRLNGVWKLVIIDDYIPCCKHTKIPLFCKPNGNEIWAMLLEKVWAKVNGGYINIDAGFTVEVLNTLTPFPTDIILHEEYEDDKLWNVILNSNKKEYILTSMTKSDESIQDVGLIPGHSCTLLNCHERKVKDTKIRLLRIRNPWGYFEWKGKYSDGSEEWDKETKQAFNYKSSKEDGIFWIEYADFKSYFVGTEICKTKKTLCDKNIIISKDRAMFANVLHLTVLHKSYVDISVLRKSNRFNKNILQNEEVISNIILISILPNFDMQIVKTTSSNKRSCVLSLELNPGDYLIYYHVDYNKGIYDKVRKYSVDVSCSEYFRLFDKGMDKTFRLLQKIVKKHVETTLKSQLSLSSCQHIVENISTGLLDTTYGYIYLKNISDIQHTILLTPHIENFYFIESNYSHLNSPQKKNEPIKFILLPDQSFIILTNTIRFYDLSEMNVDYKKFHTKPSEQYKNVSVTKNVSAVLKDFLAEPIQTQCFEYLDYSFIYNSYQSFDLSQIIRIINSKEIAIKKFKKKYPEDMNELLKLAPLNDNEDVIFRERCYIGKDYYFGEQHYASMARHGRGKFYWDADHVVFIGYSVRGVFSGHGKLIYPSGEIHEGNFKNGIIVGNGKIFKNGVWKDVVFPLKE